ASNFTNLSGNRNRFQKGFLTLRANILAPRKDLDFRILFSARRSLTRALSAFARFFCRRRYKTSGRLTNSRSSTLDLYKSDSDQLGGATPDLTPSKKSTSNFPASNSSPDIFR